MKNKKITLALMAISIALIAAGIILNQQHDVFVKAINICLECVGIG